ncbi:uncharacterized protein N7459_008382 [Penicillium hispanicum]|uniref:uncharacterized protein n=1 Tax=Penicillium hispanicum TaxID=1080232 RepID=UPI0025415039|nr:uncharacterized protein N7459_008382 [Penicillium hispanicum]KAJ5573955.1 hypothetical protein N7459_008382 [Penicillium hispanicum]
MPALWYCCECNFGPHNSGLYNSCINCGEHRCPYCVEEKVDRLSAHSHSHSTAHLCDGPDAYGVAIPTLYSVLSQTMLPAGVTNMPRTRPLAGPLRLYSQTYMYICCVCGDGPKVYNVQPQCVICQHKACDCCTNVK